MRKRIRHYAIHIGRWTLHIGRWTWYVIVLDHHCADPRQAFGRDQLRLIDGARNRGGRDAGFLGDVGEQHEMGSGVKLPVLKLSVKSNERLWNPVK